MVIVAKWVDAETGEEIIAYQWRGRLRIIVRDAVTKLFIRGIKGLTVAATLVFDYPPAKARKNNPLYVDVKTASTVLGEDLDKVDEIEKELVKKARDILEHYMNAIIANAAEEETKRLDGIPPNDKLEVEYCIGKDLPRTVGIEYIAVPISEAYPEYHWWIIWHHYKDDCKEEDGVGTL